MFYFTLQIYVLRLYYVLHTTIIYYSLTIKDYFINILPLKKNQTLLVTTKKRTFVQ